MANDVSTTVENGLCVSCGACGAVCGADAIRETFRDGLFIPEVDPRKCVSCGLCRKVCPGAPTDVAATYGPLDFADYAPLASYRLRAKCANARLNASSGGFVSTLVAHLISDGSYKRAYVLDFENFSGGKAEVSPTDDPSAVFRAARSKYIPAGVGKVIRAVRKKDIAGSIVVCTPCQLLAIRKAMDVFNVPGDDVLFVGLFCDSIMDYRVYRYYEGAFGKFDVFHFKDKRVGGWPGGTMLERADGAKTAVDMSVRFWPKSHYMVGRCRFCFDKLNRLADISAGDCYVPGAGDALGLSNVLIRTKKGEAAIERCRGLFDMREEPFAMVRNSQMLDRRLNNYERGMRETDMYKNADAPRPSGGGRARTFNVFVDVEGFANRGDQLMLDACVQQIRLRLPGAVISVPEKAFLENPSWCMAHQIRPLLKLAGKQRRRMRQRFRRFIERAVLRRASFVLPDEIDLVLFAAGFNYGDQLADLYTPANIAAEVRYFASFTKPGRKFVLLPQALGPFRTPQAKEKMSRLFPYVDLVYAREDVSAANLREILPDAKNVRTVPDFTCLCEPLGGPIRLKAKSYVALIPNMRMVDRTEEKVSRSYMAFCVELVRALSDRGETVVLLNHEGIDDDILCHEINAHFGNSLTILSGLSGIDCKAVIARAKLVVSSRFHGVVSGLVEGVPTLCTSWSHKYGELLKEHGRPGNALDVLDVEGGVAKACDALERPEEYASAPGCAERVRERVLAMWDEIFATVPEWAADCVEPKYRLF